MKIIIYFVLTLFLSHLSVAYEVTRSEPSFSCSQAEYFAEIYTCQDSQLMELDNRIATEYSFFRKLEGSDQGVVSSQKRWVAKKNACTTYKCLRDSYQIRLQEVRGKLADYFVNNKSECIGNELEAIFTHIANKPEFKNMREPLIGINTLVSDRFGGGIDLDDDGVDETQVTLRDGGLEAEACNSMNCSGESEVVIKIDACYTTIKVPFNRLSVLNKRDISSELKEGFDKLGFSKNFSIVSTYNVLGCTGSEGIETYYGLDIEKRKYISFASKYLKCSGEESELTFK